MAEYQLSERQTAVAMLAQSALFIGAGVWLRSLASDEALSAIPVTDVLSSPVSAILFTVISILIVVGVNLGLYALMTKSSEGFRIADRESSLKVKDMLYLDKPSSLFSLFHASLGEEMLFRYGGVALLASALMVMGNPELYAVVGAVVVVSVIFAVLHSQYSSAGQVFAVFIAGTVLGMVYIIGGSVIIAWIAHFVSNVSAMMFEPKIRKTLGYGDNPLGDNFFSEKREENSKEEENIEENARTERDDVNGCSEGE